MVPQNRTMRIIWKSKMAASDNIVHLTKKINIRTIYPISISVEWTYQCFLRLHIIKFKKSDQTICHPTLLKGHLKPPHNHSFIYRLNILPHGPFAWTKYHVIANTTKVAKERSVCRPNTVRTPLGKTGEDMKGFAGTVARMSLLHISYELNGYLKEGIRHEGWPLVI